MSNKKHEATLIASISARKKIRSQFGGAFLVELLIAVLVASIMGAAIVGSMSDCLRVTSKAEAQVQAASVAQQVLDSCRNRPFIDLITPAPAGCRGSGQTVEVHGYTSSSNYPNLFPRALILEMSNSYSTDSSGNQRDTVTGWDKRGIDNRFRGTVTADVVQVGGNDPNNVDVTVTVNWAEGSGTRRYSIRSRITRFGIRSS